MRRCLNERDHEIVSVGYSDRWNDIPFVWKADPGCTQMRKKIPASLIVPDEGAGLKSAFWKPKCLEKKFRT